MCKFVINDYNLGQGDFLAVHSYLIWEARVDGHLHAILCKKIVLRDTEMIFLQLRDVIQVGGKTLMYYKIPVIIIKQGRI